MKPRPLLLLLFAGLLGAAQPWDIPFARDASAVLAAAQSVAAPPDSGGVVVGAVDEATIKAYIEARERDEDEQGFKITG